jgi:hypothetical protein
MGLLWAVVVGAAHGQEHLVQPHPAMACIGVADAASSEMPEYPFGLFKHGIEGEVRIQLTFVAPDTAPNVKVIAAPDDSSFEESVLKHVKHLRVPCAHASDLPFVLVRQYAFKKDSRQTFVLDDDRERAQKQQEMLSCLRHRTGLKIPKYSSAARRENVQGAVLVTYRFTSATEPPSFTVTAPQELELLQEATKRWFVGMSMPCYDGEPFHGHVIYKYQLEGDAYGFKPDISFKEMLALSSKSRLASLPRSSVDMSCPFDVRLTYFMPHQPNSVSQVGDSDARRKPLLDWFADLLLQLPKDADWTVFGDSTTFQVPCYQFK